MPHYQWVCPKCGHAWDAVCKIGERDQHLSCPECKTVGEMDWSDGRAPVWHMK